ncbi:uncharacterized protein LOC118381951 isoform X3 [Oncorhynchus keta]|uniref:uncharacterized protein LOC118381951 isoform X3 n=1 Tax=Oncorhynchus keta TaxID=8018 RepID=UPI00227A23EB|nr:uncharacterized protein LOC118381951 isoform X3 [Oncorhynchus keta]
MMYPPGGQTSSMMYPPGGQTSSMMYPPGGQTSSMMYPPGGQTSSMMYPPGGQTSSMMYPPGGQTSLLPPYANKEDYEEEYDDYSTQTPDYDYTATFDYTYFREKKNVEEKDLENKALAIGSPCPVLLLGLAAHQLHRLL